MNNCTLCDDCIRYYTRNKVILDGICRQAFHAECVSFNKDALLYYREMPNLQWLCDTFRYCISEDRFQLPIVIVSLNRFEVQSRLRILCIWWTNFRPSTVTLIRPMTQGAVDPHDNVKILQIPRVFQHFLSFFTLCPPLALHEQILSQRLCVEKFFVEIIKNFLLKIYTP